MPVIAYQSFNSNSSKTHSLQALANQHHTKLAGGHAVGNKDQALVLPTVPGNLQLPVEGPPALVNISLPSGQPSAALFGTHIELLAQNVNRAIQRMPDLTVLGELDLSSGELAPIGKFDSVNVVPVVADKACQCFSAIDSNKAAVAALTSGNGFAAFSVDKINVVFVHVPNAVATKQEGVTNFYRGIAQGLAAMSRTVDVVIGDTNQSGSGWTPKILNMLFGTNVFRNAHGSDEITKVDNYNKTEGGTNSTGSKMYDVAVYRSDIVALSAGPAYISQSPTGFTVTDHCAIAVGFDRT